MSWQYARTYLSMTRTDDEKRWFFGGGAFTWKLSSANQDIGLWEVDMVEGKRTPIHTHPVSESMWVLEGQIQYRVNDDEHELGAGDFVMAPAGIPHALIVKSSTAISRGASSRHRVYGEGDLDQLMWIACLAATGMSVSGIEIVGLHRSGAHPSAAFRALGRCVTPRLGAPRRR